MENLIGYFQKHQAILLAIANSQTGRHLLHVPAGVNKVMAIYPGGYHWDTGERVRGRAILTGNFFCANWVALQLVPIVERLEILRQEARKFYPQNRMELESAISHFSTNLRIHRHSSALPVIYLTNFTDAAGEGRVTRNNEVLWSTAHDSGAGTGTDGAVGCRAGINGGNYFLGRDFLPFDTTTIPGGSIITSGVNTIKEYRDDTVLTFINDQSVTYTFVSNAQASATSLGTSDYNTLGTTSFGGQTLSGTSNNTYFTVTLNANGDANITSAGYSKFGGRMSNDISNTAPAGDNALGMQNVAAANPPTLSVTFISSSFDLTSKIW